MKIEIEVKAHKASIDWWEKRHAFRRKMEEALIHFIPFADAEFKYTEIIEDSDLPPEP